MNPSLFRPGNLGFLRILPVFTVVGLLVLRCGYTQPVIGQEDVLVILASDEDRPLLEPMLNDVFSRTMATPAPEPFFQVRWASPFEFETYQNYKSLVIASLANPADSTGDLLIRRILGEERVAEALEGGNPIYHASDFLARGQLFMGFIALDAIHLQKELDRLRTWVFDQFEQQLRIRQHEIVYKYRYEKKLARELEQKYGWRFKIQHDYVTIREKPEENFVWLGRGYPYRWMSVHWVEQADTVSISPEWSWKRMEYIAEDLYTSIYLDSLFRSSELGDQNGHILYVLRGVWAHKVETAGGPFTTYVFRDRDQNRVYFLTGIVFNPSGSKALMVRQQEVIMRTFHTFEEPPASSASRKGENLT